MPDDKTVKKVLLIDRPSIANEERFRVATSCEFQELSHQATDEKRNAEHLVDLTGLSLLPQGSANPNPRLPVYPLFAEGGSKLAGTQAK